MPRPAWGVPPATPSHPPLPAASSECDSDIFLSIDWGALDGGLQDELWLPDQFDSAEVCTALAFGPRPRGVPCLPALPTYYCSLYCCVQVTHSASCLHVMLPADASQDSDVSSTGCCTPTGLTGVHETAAPRASKKQRTWPASPSAHARAGLSAGGLAQQRTGYSRDVIASSLDSLPLPPAPAPSHPPPPPCQPATTTKTGPCAATQFLLHHLALCSQEAKEMLDDLGSVAPKGKAPSRFAIALRAYRVSPKLVLRKWAFCAITSCYDRSPGEKDSSHPTYFLSFPAAIQATLPPAARTAAFDDMRKVKEYIVHDVLRLSKEQVPGIAENMFTVGRAYIILNAFYTLHPPSFGLPLTLKWLPYFLY